MAEEMGLRERKKIQTGLRVWSVAIDLFLEHGFDKVSVAQIAAVAEVSKMTVFNYYGTKEDLVLNPMERHVDDPARAVRERASGESAVAALRRQYLELVAVRDASVGLSADPRVLKVRQLIRDTPALLRRAHDSARRSTELLAEALTEETGEPFAAAVAAAQLMAARNALNMVNHRRMTAGDPPEKVAEAAAELAGQAFDQVENGLHGFATRA